MLSDGDNLADDGLSFGVIRVGSDEVGDRAREVLLKVP